jgi:hypothetical protein
MKNWPTASENLNHWRGNFLANTPGAIFPFVAVLELYGVRPVRRLAERGGECKRIGRTGYVKPGIARPGKQVPYLPVGQLEHGRDSLARYGHVAELVQVMYRPDGIHKLIHTTYCAQCQAFFAIDTSGRLSTAFWRMESVARAYVCVCVTLECPSNFETV